MHIISTSQLKKFWEKHPSSKTSLRLWCKVAETTDWQNLIEVKEAFSSADPVGNLTVFNIGGNKYRLITFIDYKYKKIFIRNILTHTEYDEDVWKKDTWY
jgi:mRNA interferase HigB